LGDEKNQSTSSKKVKRRKYQEGPAMGKDMVPQIKGG
jgi:hypothetical protein